MTVAGKVVIIEVSNIKLNSMLKNSVLVLLAFLLIAGGVYHFQTQRTNDFTINSLRVEGSGLQSENKDLSSKLSSLQTGLRECEIKASSASALVSAPHDVQFVRNDKYTEYKLVLDGKEIESFKFERAMLPHIFKQTENGAYISFSREGLGGYILYNNGWPTYRLDFAAKEVKKISEQAEDISPSGALVAYMEGDMPPITRKLVLINLATGERKEFPLPKNYKQFGDVKISPNEQKIAFAASFGNPDKEGGNAFIVDIKSGKQEQLMLEDVLDKPMHVIGWVDNEKVDFR